LLIKTKLMPASGPVKTPEPFGLHGTLPEERPEDEMAREAPAIAA
jgi:hypothetical protein